MYSITNINKNIWISRSTFAKKRTMKKAKDYELKLVEGQYTPLEAKKILLGLINSKINFHQLENFSNEIRFNENTAHSRIRIELLTDALENITALIAYSTLNNMQFKIDGSIQISLVPEKTLESIVQKN
jgi:hypothetical protein